MLTSRVGPSRPEVWWTSHPVGAWVRVYPRTLVRGTFLHLRGTAHRSVIRLVTAQVKYPSSLFPCPTYTYIPSRFLLALRQATCAPLHADIGHFSCHLGVLLSIGWLRAAPINLRRPRPALLALLFRAAMVPF